MRDLEVAERILRLAAGGTDIRNRSKAERHVDSGTAYCYRFQVTGSLAALDQGISQFNIALGRKGDTNFDEAEVLTLLGLAYSDKLVRTNSLLDCDTSIKYLQEALSLTPEDDLQRSRRISSLGFAHGQRFRINNVIADIETAIRLCQESLEAKPIDKDNHARYLQNLGAMYMMKYRTLKMVNDLNMGIENFEQGLAQTKADQQHRPILLSNMGQAYEDKFLVTGDKADIVRASQQYIEVGNLRWSTPETNFRAGKRLFHIFTNATLWSLAYKIAVPTVHLIAKLVPQSLHHSEKQELMIQAAELTSDGTAAALLAEKPASDAIQLLEAGRGNIVASSNEMRTDLTELQEQHPEKAKLFMDAAKLLQEPSFDSRIKLPQRHDGARNVDEAIRIIRELEGFDRFLAPPSMDELKGAALDGPVVIINTNKLRCDAFLVETSEMRALPLPSLYVQDIRDRLEANERGTRETLEWLWEAVAMPVLDALGFTSRPTGDYRPRIWWIPTGPLSLFPIHAAGYHLENLHGDTVMDRVISSYSSSVKALIHARQRKKKKSAAPSNQTAVLVGANELKYAPIEIEKLSPICSSMHNMRVARPEPRHEEVVEALEDCDIFHSAGHGETNFNDPSKSSIVLSDRALTVARLFALNLQDRPPLLAYLSACGTGQVGHEQLFDESLHLISAFQVAGFQNVIGTLWAVQDGFCVDVAVETYEWMKAHGLSYKSVSEGLHFTIRKFRDEWVSEISAAAQPCSTERQSQVGMACPDEAVKDSYLNRSGTGAPRDATEVEETPLLWVPYIHYGI